MTLAEFLEPLQTTTATLVLKDFTSGNEIVTMKAAGYINLDNSLEESEVKSWGMSISPATLTVSVNITTSQTTEVTNEES